MSTAPPSDKPVVGFEMIKHCFGKTVAVDGVTLDLPAGRMVGFIGPDGVGKSTLLSLVSGARIVQDGTVTVLGGDIANKSHRVSVCPRIAYMPQGLGKNLYPTLSVEENLQFFGRLFGQNGDERRRRIDELTNSTGLKAFLPRPAGKLSGGMKQKLGLCCALIHDPDLLILDEPTTGVDPLSRRQFWDLIDHIRKVRSGMSVIVATGYMEEADRFDWLVAMDAGKILSTGTPGEFRERTKTTSLEAAFISLLPEAKKRGHHAVVVPPFVESKNHEVAIEAKGLTMQFGSFLAVDHVAFRIRQGEIFGFLGSNGCGKSTTMKMLTGLLPASEGQAWLFGKVVDSADIASRRRVGYMSQAFSLYGELTVRQNLVLDARLFKMPEAEIPQRVDEMVARFGLGDVLDSLPGSLPLGISQRLSLAVAVMHKPELLILDEPTSGVDPIARDLFWQLMIDLSRNDRVTIFISTHFMDEAARCDRISLMNAGKVLVTDTPAAVVKSRGKKTLEEAFIAYLEQATAGKDGASVVEPVKSSAPATPAAPESTHSFFSVARAWSYTLRETLELKRDPLRATLALVGSAFLMLLMGYGVNLDVQNLSYAILDHDQSMLSEDYALNISGSAYFIKHPPIRDYADLDQRMRSGELSLAIEIPPEFGRDIDRGRPVQVAAWVDGSMPTRGETVNSYMQGMHQLWLSDVAKHRLGEVPQANSSLETRFRYNPEVLSVPAMVPGMIPLLLMMIPAMLTALSVVREKELGSIINLYVTPVTRSEFLIGKQLPYVALAMFSFLLMTTLAVTVFGVPVKGSFLALTLGALVFCIASTGFGLLVSTFTNSQIAAIFLAIIATMIPISQFCGLIDPVSSLVGFGAFIGHIYPATYFLNISRGVFNKALNLSDLGASFWPLMASVPVILGLSIMLLKKQDK